MKRLSLLLLLALAACTAPPAQRHSSTPPGSSAPAPVPAPASAPLQGHAEWQWYQDAANTGQRIWRINSPASLIAVTVRRGGALARLGHDHVVASQAVEGYVAPDGGRADFQFRLDQLQVDDPGLRQQAGLTTHPSTEAIEGTRTNMLTRVLDAGRYPVVAMQIASLDTRAAVAGKALPVNLRIHLHGTERTVVVPTTIALQDGGLVASGSFVLNQTDFGITPMSVLGGAMVVADQLEIRFRLVAGPGQAQPGVSATRSASGPTQ